MERRSRLYFSRGLGLSATPAYPGEAGEVAGRVGGPVLPAAVGQGLKGEYLVPPVWVDRDGVGEGVAGPIRNRVVGR